MKFTSFAKKVLVHGNCLSRLNSSYDGTIFEYPKTNTSNPADFMETASEKYSKGTESYLVSESSPSTQDWKHFSSLMMFEDFSEQFSDALPDLENQ